MAILFEHSVILDLTTLTEVSLTLQFPSPHASYSSTLEYHHSQAVAENNTSEIKSYNC